MLYREWVIADIFGVKQRPCCHETTVVCAPLGGVNLFGSNNEEPEQDLGQLWFLCERMNSVKVERLKEK